MSKIIVPQELQVQIVDLYVNKQYGRMRIKNELNLPFGDTVIKRILKENDVYIRNYNEAKVGRIKQEVDKDLEQQIIRLYNQGYGLEKIVELLNTPFSFDKVRSILTDNNIHIRTVQESAQVKIMPDLRVFTVNDDYNFNSHNGAWLLGFYMADGYMPATKGGKNRVTITLQRRDEECLELIKQELNYTGKIYQFISANGYEESSLAFTSKKIRQIFENYGIVNRKSYKTIHIPNIDEEYKIDFIRGFFDGDGSIYELKGKKVGSSFTCSCKSFLDEIRIFLQDNYGLKLPSIHTVKRNILIYDIVYYKYDTLKLGSIFYENDYLALPRKKKKYFELKEKYL